MREKERKRWRENKTKHKNEKKTNKYKYLSQRKCKLEKVIINDNKKKLIKQEQ